MVILGGLVVVALFAALVAPYFINWDDYKGTFEAEAEKILGQPVRVIGSADASVLPSPSLTFTQVVVGDSNGQPMMTVDRFSVTIELMPLLQGEIKVISMKLEQPRAHVLVDDDGTVDWLVRTEASKALAPDKVSLENVEISDGAVTYADARTGIQLDIEHINAAIEARSLSGPWKIDGSYLQGETRVPFQVDTGRRLDDGSIRVKTEVSPAAVPLVIAADGVIALGEEGLGYAGTYNVTEVVVADENGDPTEPNGWRSDGTFNLTRDALVIDKAVLSQGPPDRPASLAGALTIELGKTARFKANVEARQLDLDRSLGKGPAEPAEVGKAAGQLVDWLAGLYVPPIPGQVSFNVPAIVVGGSIIQNVSFNAEPKSGGWQIAGLKASLPGRATLEANGMISTGEAVGFLGDVRLAVNQPATFAAWWRGRSEQGAGRLLAPFDLSGRATINPGEIAVEAMQMTIGDAIVSGDFSWRSEADKQRLLETDLKADKLDFVQLRALTELLAGANLADTTAIADSYSVKLAAGELAFEDVKMHDVSIDAGFVDGTLTVNEILVGDVGGAKLSVPRGRIGSILTDPRGNLEAHLSAATVTGLARVIERVAPETELAKWLVLAAPSLAPATLDLKIDAPPPQGEADFRITLGGSANSTTFDTTLDLTGSPADWRSGTATLSGSLTSYDALSLARQAGLDVLDIATPGGARLNVTAKGIAKDGLATTLSGSFAGVDFGADGNLVLPAALPPSFKGTVRLNTPDLDPLMRMAGLGIPGAALGTSIALEGTLETVAATAELGWTNGEVAGRLVGGKIRVAEVADGSFQVNGDLTLDEADLGWIASLGLGFAPLPTGDPAAPWSTAPFAEPAYGPISGKLNVTADRVAVDEGFNVAKGKFTVALQPDRVDLDLTAGDVAGGTIAGGFSIHNVGGNANITGRVSLVNVTLDSFIWERAGRPVATGLADISGNFEATGRSPAGLISTLTGGGAVAIRNGEARYVNPRALNLVVRASDLGQPFTEDTLSDLFRSFIDAGTLAFGNADGAFSIAGGTIRLKSLAVQAPNGRAVGNAAIDLNTMSIDSDWTLTLDTGADKEEATPAQVGIVFQGPLAQPNRTFDVLQFWSYLNIRQEEHVQEILAMEEAARLEKDRFGRERRKLREDAARREREAREAEEARLRALTAVETLHLNREFHEEVLAEQAKILAEAIAERLTAERAAAIEAAATAAEAASAARAEAESASAFAAEKAGVAETASAAVVAASADLADAEKAASDASASAEAGARAIEAARTDLAAKATAEEAANAAVEAAGAETSTANDAAAAAGKAAEAASSAATKAAKDAAAADQLAAEHAATAQAALSAANAAEGAEATARAAADKAIAATAAARTDSAAKAAMAKSTAEDAKVLAAAASKVEGDLAAAKRTLAAKQDAANAASATAAKADAAVAAAEATLRDAAAKRSAAQKTATDLQTVASLAAGRVTVDSAAAKDAAAALAAAEAALVERKADEASAASAVAAAASAVTAADQALNRAIAEKSRVNQELAAAELAATRAFIPTAESGTLSAARNAVGEKTKAEEQANTALQEAKAAVEIAAANREKAATGRAAAEQAVQELTAAKAAADEKAAATEAAGKKAADEAAAATSELAVLSPLEGEAQQLASKASAVAAEKRAAREKAVAEVAEAEKPVAELSSAYAAAAEKAAAADSAARIASDEATAAEKTLATLTAAEADAKIAAAEARADLAEARAANDKAATAAATVAEEAQARQAEAGRAAEAAATANAQADAAVKVTAERDASESKAVETAALASADRVAAEALLKEATDAAARAETEAAAAAKRVEEETAALAEAQAGLDAARAEEGAAETAAAEAVAKAGEAAAAAKAAADRANSLPTYGALPSGGREEAAVNPVDAPTGTLAPVTVEEPAEVSPAAVSPASTPPKPPRKPARPAKVTPKKSQPRAGPLILTPPAVR